MRMQRVKVWAHSKAPTDPEKAFLLEQRGCSQVPVDWGIRGRGSHGSKEYRDDFPRNIVEKGRRDRADDIGFHEKSDGNLKGGVETEIKPADSADREEAELS